MNHTCDSFWPHIWNVTVFAEFPSLWPWGWRRRLRFKLTSPVFKREKSLYSWLFFSISSFLSLWDVKSRHCCRWPAGGDSSSVTVFFTVFVSSRQEGQEGAETPEETNVLSEHPAQRQNRESESTVTCNRRQRPVYGFYLHRPAAAHCPFITNQELNIGDNVWNLLNSS